MDFDLTAQQKEAQAAFRAFVDETITPYADQWDRAQALPPELFQALGAKRYLVPSLPGEFGGLDMDMQTYGFFSEEMGRGCASVRNLLGVQGMMAHALLRFGNRAQQEKILTVCRVVGWVARRVGQPQVVAEMIAGVLMGPSLLGLLLPGVHAFIFPAASKSILYAVSQVGLVVYMFLIGLEFDLDLIRNRLRSAAAVQ